MTRQEYTNTTLDQTLHYVYDGYLPVLEVDGSGAKLRSYTRGLDMTQSLSGAGGVGSLLALTIHDASIGTLGSYYYGCDGNGNITVLLDAAHALSASYSYDPFGKVLSSAGSIAAANPYQFSSKEYESQWDTVYYLYRFYSPEIGRWLSRDPIGELGGVNLYGFVGNNGVNAWDYFGLDWGQWNSVFDNNYSNESDWSKVGGGEVRFRNDPGSSPQIYTMGGQGEDGLTALVYEGPYGPEINNNERVEIEFEYKIPRGSNTGFHISIPGDVSDVREDIVQPGFEIQLRDAEADGRLTDTVNRFDQAVEAGAELTDAQRQARNQRSSDRSGSIYMYADPYTDPNLNDGWNKVTVILDDTGDVDGTDITVLINGQETTNFQRTDAPLDIGTRNPEIIPNLPQEGPRDQGRIAFQGHSDNDVATFKDLRWRKWKPE